MRDPNKPPDRFLQMGRGLLTPIMRFMCTLPEQPKLPEASQLAPPDDSHLHDFGGTSVVRRRSKEPTLNFSSASSSRATHLLDLVMSQGA